VQTSKEASSIHLLVLLLVVVVVVALVWAEPENFDYGWVWGFLCLIKFNWLVN